MTRLARVSFSYTGLMMHRFYPLLFAQAVVTGSLILFPLGGMAAGPVDSPGTSSEPLKLESLSPQQARDVEAILRSLLKTHPEIIIEAVEEFATQEKLVTSEEEKRAVKGLLEDLAKNINAPVIGNAKGDITVVEFFDYNCPYCRQISPDILRFLREDGRIRMVMLEFPVLGPTSIVAAKAALAADNQGKYAEMHTALMSATTRHDEASIMMIAAGLGLDMKKLKADMDSKAVMDRLTVSFHHANALGLQGTPAFLIENLLYPGALPAAKLAEFVATARKNK
ncbi:MAG: DsbA family protein [Alphaproteobacteria bacterium]